MTRRHLKDRLEGALLHLLLGTITCLPPTTASALGGKLGRWIGPWLAGSRIAHRNLARAFPHLSLTNRKQLLEKCWENLGSTLFEFPHLGSLPQAGNTGRGWRIEGRAHLEAAKASGRPVIFFSGHLGNWELMPLLVAREGLAFAPFYRAPNNPQADRLLRTLRQKIAGTQLPMFAKGARGARQAMAHLARGGHLGILGDQKMNDGIACRFFGHSAMTAPAAAALALRFDALIVTGHVQREGPARLVLKVDPLLDSRQWQRRNRPEAVESLTTRLNEVLEGWIRDCPHNWLWIHRRWDKSFYR
ncbi:lysophospholipid acyltransferase family protein [Oecophyllibacter saccharovorans]|uniref:lysophospholipid acyltransferase family protein n=1 Tax=Oecophyllibacter saccharovorans TaxID=2558360 RepID=UPI001141A725|nr:lauroyl acyltransferase [Oecophyllibacter saccharovorans]QDH14566.1 lauroyl acyltransferase [Oecophyllibacter saccharovorans]TPW34764.1 lauroyl acyltransferase [Oecophyllibacter saccharovorans]